jgi:ribosomal protein S27AE
VIAGLILNSSGDKNMTNSARTHEHTIEAQRRVCPERWCGRGAWLVRRDARLPDVWQLTHAADGGAWSVAGSAPACPRCGSTLLTTLELEGGFGESDIVQPGPLLDWLRTL